MKGNASDDQKPWQPTRAYMQRIEEHAMLLRRRANVGLLDRLDPRSVANTLHLQFVQLDAIEGLRPETLQSIVAMDAREWSGMGKLLPNNDLLVALNPNMTVERESVTIMEEVAHAYYGHQPVTLLPLALGRRRARRGAAGLGGVVCEVAVMRTPRTPESTLAPAALERWESWPLWCGCTARRR